MEQQQGDSAMHPPAVPSPQDSETPPLRSPLLAAPSHAPHAAETAPAEAAPVQGSSASSPETTSTPSVQQGPFSSTNFPALASAPPSRVPPSDNDKSDQRAQQDHTSEADRHMADGRATFVLPKENRLPQSLHMSTAAGAASLSHRAAEPNEPAAYSWYDPGAAQREHPHEEPAASEPRSVPMQRSPPPAYKSPGLDAALLKSPTQVSAAGERRSSVAQAEGGGCGSASSSNAHEVRDGASAAGVVVDSNMRATSTLGGTSGAGDADSSTGRKRGRDEQQDIAVGAPAGGSSAALATELSNRTALNETNDAASATTDDDAEGAERETQRRRVESTSSEAQQALQLQLQQPQQQFPTTAAHFQQWQYQYWMQQRSLSGGFVPQLPTTAQQAFPTPGYPQQGQQYYASQFNAQQHYPGGRASLSGSISSDEDDPQAASSSPTAARGGHGQPHRQQRAHYGTPYGTSSSTATHSYGAAYSPTTAITSPLVPLAGPGPGGPSDRRSSGPVPAPFGAGLPHMEQKQAFGAVAPAQEEAGGTGGEADKPTRARGAKCDNPYMIQSVRLSPLSRLLQTCR